MDTKIGFIGLGAMGKPMAINLIRNGYKVFVPLRNEKTACELIEMGAHVLKSNAEVANACDVMITILPADKEIIDVYTGDNGIIRNIRNGGVCIEMTSARGETVKQISQDAKSIGKDITFIDAPVSGGVSAAEKGTLTIMLGGNKQDIEKYQSIFSILGKKMFYTGGIGSGKSIKMINQFLNAGNTFIASEALVMAETMGLDMNLMCEVVNESSGASWIFKNNVPKHMMKEYFDTGFKLSLMKKDIGLCIEQAHMNHLSLPAMNLIYQIYEAVNNQGYGDKSYNIVSQWVKQQNR